MQRRLNADDDAITETDKALIRLWLELTQLRGSLDSLRAKCDSLSKRIAQMEGEDCV